MRWSRGSLGLLASVALVSGAGCSALISPDESRLGGTPRADGGTRDAPITLVDGSTLPDRTGRVDAPPVSCEGDQARCDENVLVQCVAGMEVRTNCALAGGSCSNSGPIPSCVGGGCAPPGSRCDGAELVTCHGDGSETRTTCSGGCDPASATCIPSRACLGIPELPLGETAFDLCLEDDDYTYVPSGMCSADARANAGDRIYRIDIATPTTIVLDLRDDAPTAVDTALYVRTDCEEAASQIACSDDIPCADSVIPTGCMGGFQVRESRLVLTLEPGTYYVVADAFLYATSAIEFRCGQVVLTYAGAG